MEKIYELEKEHGVATTGAIAEMMDIKPPSVTQMFQKLNEEGYIEYNPYKGATLTSKGKRKAEELQKKHETLTEFLVLVGVEEEDADRDACQIEHVVSQCTVEQLKLFTDYVKETKRGRELFEKFERYCKE